MRKNSKPGRPRFRATAALKNKVAIAAGGGMAHEEIALALGISRNTLEKYFPRELSIGAYEKQLEALQAMHRMAKKGNVAAQKAYLSKSPAASAPPIPKAEQLGKKEQAQADAKTAQAGTDWNEILSNPNVVPIKQTA